jgi:hypothetical protein
MVEQARLLSKVAALAPAHVCANEFARRNP